MRIRFLRAASLLLSIGLASSAQTQTTDPIQALKNTLSPDQQSSIMQSVLGKGDGTGKKSDKKLDSPETVNQKNDEENTLEKPYKHETYDHRILRQMDEDPELRAGDTVLIELTPIDVEGAMNGTGQSVGGTGNNGGNGNNAGSGAN